MPQHLFMDLNKLRALQEPQARDFGEQVDMIAEERLHRTFEAFQPLQSHAREDSAEESA